MNELDPELDYCAITTCHPEPIDILGMLRLNIARDLQSPYKDSPAEKRVWNDRLKSSQYTFNKNNNLRHHL